MVRHFFLFLVSLFSTLIALPANGVNTVDLVRSDLDVSVTNKNTAYFRFEGVDYLVLKPLISDVSALKSAGFVFQSYLGGGQFLVSVKSQNALASLSSLKVEKLGYLATTSKIDPSLNGLTSPVSVTVLYGADVDQDILASICSKEGVQLFSNNKTYHRFNAVLNASQLLRLANYPFIFYLSKYFEKKNPLCYESSLMMGVNQVQELNPYGYQLKGDGLNIGIWDEGAYGTHIDLPVNKNFVIDKLYSYSAVLTHATYVAGCLGGAGNVYYNSKGMAPGCSMYYWDLLDDLVDEIRTGKSIYDIDISNHSYNFAATDCNASGSYIPEAADLDRLVYEHPSLLPVVAVGNSGAVACAVRTDTFRSVDIGFQGCKNAITVGWLFGNKTIATNSGRGPTSDGRLKPELVAKGWGVSTTAPNNSFITAYGSSFSAPMVSGLAALLYQKYKQQFNALPNGALIKAILCNTARDLGRTGPDYTYGFGLPDAKAAVSSIVNNLYYEDDATQGAFAVHSISIPYNTSKVKITLSWIDKEGSPVASSTLVNNLDLKLVTPTGDTVLPWKLNPNAYKNIATRGIDNINNIEQVTLDNPVTGNYTVVVKGTAIPFGPQHFAVAFMAQEKKVELSYPNGGEVLDTSGLNAVRWYANGVDTLSKIEFSADSGQSWQTIMNNQQLSAEIYSWKVPAVVSNKCLVRISYGNRSAVSAAPFTIVPQLTYAQITHAVCDRTVKINWSAVGGASGYRIYLFTDSVWTFIGQTNLLTYTINNLTNGKAYSYAISAVVNGVESNHSYANSFTPTSRACSTLNDVGVYAIGKSLGGRLETSSALTATQKISFIVKNYGTATQNSIPVFYTVNNGPVRSIISSDIVTSNDTSMVNFLVDEDLSAVGNYSIKAWTSLSADDNSVNDTLNTMIRQLSNSPLVLPFKDGYETLNVNYSGFIFGLNGLEYADYNPQTGARLRSNEGNTFAFSGNRCIALDNYSGTTTRNELFFTFNLSAYKDSLVFLDFNYLNRGEQDGNDSIFVRGDDNSPWVFLLDLYANRGTPGAYKLVSEQNLYQKLKVENGQDFSSSTQFRIVQTGSKASTSPYNDGGYSFDDFKLYVAGRDVAVTNAFVKQVHCSNSFSPQRVSLTVRNNSAQPVVGLPVFYQVNNHPVVTQIIPDTIYPLSSLTYSFDTLFNYAAPGVYTVKVWTENQGDNYKLNDSASALAVKVMQSVAAFPYYNDFESNNGGFFAEGVNNSWVWSSPQKYIMNNAAQDTKAWTTGVNKGYNFRENSYVYMGCFDFSSLNTDPLISFNILAVMHTQSDSAFIEYSTDGDNWERLGCYNCGVNWYNGYQNKPYWDRDIYPWQLAQFKVPLASLSDKSSFMYRMHLLSDNFIVSEGVGIDDLHVLKDYVEIREKDSAYVTQVSTGNGWIQFYRNGKIVAELFDDYKNLGAVTIGFEADSSKHKLFDNKNILSRNWVVKAQHQQLGNFKLRLYLLNSEYVNFVSNEDSVNRMGDVNVLRYIGLNTNLDIADNYVNAYFKYYSPQDIQFFPYLNGYYVEFNADTLGEFYLISSKQDADAIQNINLIDFSARKVNDDVYLEWKTTREINSNSFVIQYSFDASNFIDIDTVPAGGTSSATTLYNYLHQLNATLGVYYYRIKMLDNQNKTTFSLIDSVYFSPNLGISKNTASVTSYVSENDIVVEIHNKLSASYLIVIYNAAGQQLFSTQRKLMDGLNPLGISDFSHWSDGVYFVKISSDSHSYYSKLMKQ